MSAESLQTKIDSIERTLESVTKTVDALRNKTEDLRAKLHNLDLEVTHIKNPPPELLSLRAKFEEQLLSGITKNSTAIKQLNDDLNAKMIKYAFVIGIAFTVISIMAKQLGVEIPTKMPTLP